MSVPIPSPADPEARILVLDRQGCHLCASAVAIATAEAERAGTRLERLDVDTDPALREAWGEQVPVIIVDGAVHARYRVDPTALRRALAPGPRWRRLLPGR